jgi:two-component system, OmpR family, sensor kinase
MSASPAWPWAPTTNVTKPFSLDEVVERIRAVLRRAGRPAAATRLRVAGLELDEESHEVRRDGTLIALTPTEFRLLQFLMLNAGHVLSKGQILHHVWDHNPAGEIADALAGAVAVAVLAGVGLPLVRASLAPLRRIEATAAAIAGGDLSRRIDHPARDTEVGRLADALDAMLGRIEAAYQARAEGEARALRSEDRMRQFVADASHELRTPLTSVSGLAEFGLQQGDAASPGELLRLMTLIQHEASRMRRLVEDLLLLARFDTDRSLDRHHVDLASIAAQAVQAARIVNPERTITLRAGEPVIVYADTERLRQVIDNLIGNATQHTPPQSPVTVSVTSTPETGEIIVADNGPGMTPEQAAHIFERFYRTDGARSRARGGTGLGLSIAASLAAAHGGDITVDTKPGQGAAFHVRLPLAASVDGDT